jgi:hypothetical protein
VAGSPGESLSVLEIGDRAELHELASLNVGLSRGLDEDTRR